MEITFIKEEGKNLWVAEDLEITGKFNLRLESDKPGIISIFSSSVHGRTPVQVDYIIHKGITDKSYPDVVSPVYLRIESTTDISYAHLHIEASQEEESTKFIEDLLINFGRNTSEPVSLNDLGEITAWDESISAVVKLHDEEYDLDLPFTYSNETELICEDEDIPAELGTILKLKLNPDNHTVQLVTNKVLIVKHFWHCRILSLDMNGAQVYP